jgi:DNA-binding transcriptional MocR family regulator
VARSHLLEGDRGWAIRDEAARRGVALTAMSDYYLDPADDSSMLLLGYARSSEALIRAGVRRFRFRSTPAALI